jgi:hypothetical protein
METNNFGNVPVNKATLIKNLVPVFLGIDYYFKPRNEYNIFEYSEQREEPNDKYFKTSFHLYMFPVITFGASFNIIKNMVIG